MAPLRIKIREGISRRELLEFKGKQLFIMSCRTLDILGPQIQVASLVSMMVNPQPIKKNVLQSMGWQTFSVKVRQ